MTLLTNPSEEVVKMVTNLYNNNCTGTTNSNMAANQNTGSNPFGLSSNSNTMNAASIFGGSNATPAGNTNLFGSSTTSTNPFAKSTSAFGAPAQTQPSTNLFGGSNSAFGSTTSTPSNNLFGGSSFSSNPNAGGSIFGGSQSTSVFGSPAAPGPFPNSSPFALPQANTPSMGSSLFQSNTQNATFGGAPTFGAPKPGLFAQANVSLGQQSANTGNIFGQNVQPQNFGAMNTATTQSQPIFGAQNQVQSNAFGLMGQSTQANSIFGGNAQQQTQQQQKQQPSLFQNNTNTFGGSNTFANPNQAQTAQSIFGAGNTQSMGFNQTSAPLAQTMQQPSQQQQSIFGSSSFTNPAPAYQSNSSARLFTNPQEPPAQQQQNAQSIFGQGAQNHFGASAQQSSTMYTPMDALSVDEIEAFRSDAFDITKIPTKPPPMEMCR